MIRPRHSFESVVRELREGLENGSVVLASKAETAQDVANAWNLGYQLGKSAARVYTFTTTVAEQRLFMKRNVTRRLVVTVSGDKVIYASGDISDIQKFDIPDEIKLALAAALSVAAASLLKTENNPSDQAGT